MKVAWPVRECAAKPVCLCTELTVTERIWMASTSAKRTVFQDFDGIMVLVKQLGQKTDAGVAMIVAAALDRLLEAALLTKMVKLNREKRDRIFGEYGALQGFSAKIDVAFSLGIVDRETYNSLTVVRKIRNQFAHTEGSLNFESEAIRGLLPAHLPTTPESQPIDAFIAMVGNIEARVAETAGLTNCNVLSKIDAAR